MSITADNYFTVLHSLEDFLKYESQRLGILGDTGLAPVNAPSIVPSPVNTPPLAALLSPGTANWKGQLCGLFTLSNMSPRDSVKFHFG
jgi:hypothetical protein